MHMYSSQSTYVEVDWSEIKLNSIPLQHMWIEVDTHASKQGCLCIHLNPHVLKWIGVELN